MKYCSNTTIKNTERYLNETTMVYRKRQENPSNSIEKRVFLDYVEKSLKSLPRQGFRAEKWNCTNR